MHTYHGIGLMSGTSLDGIDLAYCQFAINSGGVWTYEIQEAVTRSYSPEWRQRLALLQDESAEGYARAHVAYGHLLGGLLRDFIAGYNLEPQFVASHGHTIFHQPDSQGFTAQIGDGETIATYLDCPLVTNLRSKDVALGGQGAPLVPFGEKHLFHKARLFLNLGGFSNISHDGHALDVSPCNFALNWAVARHDPSFEYDPEGSMARSGRILPELLRSLDALEYYSRPAPKSLGREWFEQNFLPLLRDTTRENAADVLRTLTEHIAGQIAAAIDQAGSRNAPMIVTGGGARNSFLMELLAGRLKPLGVEIETGTSSYLIDYKEALIFAFLGLHVLVGQVNTLPTATGARIACPSGSIHLPVSAAGYPILTPWK